MFSDRFLLKGIVWMFYSFLFLKYVLYLSTTVSLMNWSPCVISVSLPTYTGMLYKYHYNSKIKQKKNTEKIRCQLLINYLFYGQVFHPQHITKTTSRCWDTYYILSGELPFWLQSLKFCAAGCVLKSDSSIVKTTLNEMLFTGCLHVSLC